MRNYQTEVQNTQNNHPHPTGVHHGKDQQHHQNVLTTAGVLAPSQNLGAGIGDILGTKEHEIFHN